MVLQSKQICLLLFLAQVTFCGGLFEEILSDIPDEIHKIYVIALELSDIDTNNFANLPIIPEIFSSPSDFYNHDLDAQSLVILQNLNQPDLNSIFYQATQNLLSLNLWIIDSKEKVNFTGNQFRFGLNMLLFQYNDKTEILTQFLGDGTTFPVVVEIGLLSTINWKTLIDGTKYRRTFNGLEFKANFADFPPFCYCKVE